MQVLNNLTFGLYWPQDPHLHHDQTKPLSKSHLLTHSNFQPSLQIWSWPTYILQGHMITSQSYSRSNGGTISEEANHLVKMHKMYLSAMHQLYLS